MNQFATEQLSVIRDARGKRPDFYETAGVDEVMSMVLVLANEFSVLRDRLDSTERVIKGHGIDLAAGIEALELDQQALEEREARRQDFLSRLFYVARKRAKEAAEKESREGFRATIEEIAVR